MSKRMMTAVGMALVLIWAASASAQDGDFFTPDREQVALLKKGARASSKGEHDKAIRYYRAALAIEPFNMAHLSLGRALQKTGDCQGALTRFEAARKSRQVRVPSPEQVHARLDTYTAELKQTCPGTLALTCSSAEISLTLDKEPIECGEPIERPAGTYTLIAVLGEIRQSHKIEIVALELTDLDITIEAPEKPEEIKPTPRVDLDAYPKATIVHDENPRGEDPEATTSGHRAAGWSLVAGGTALLITGGVFTVLVDEQSRASEALSQERVIDPKRARQIRDTGDLYFALQITTYALGAASLVTGAWLLIVDEPGEPRASWQLRPWIAPESAGASFGLGF